MNCLQQSRSTARFVFDRVDREIGLAQTPIDTIVGQHLAALRTARNITQAQLATAIATTEIQIARYEAGTDRVSAAHLVAISQYLGVALADFFPRPDPGSGSQVH
jgi:DNA-binding transcriptional regulator YiaG